MRRLLFPFAFLAAGPAQAIEFCELPQGFEERAREQFEWIAEETGYVYGPSSPLPTYVCASQRELYIIRNPRSFQALEREGQAPGLDLLAVYDPHTETMFVNEDADLMAPETWFTLAHEHTHHLQARNGVHQRVACSNEMEPEAYEVSDRWHELHGTGFKSDPFTVRMIASCGES